MTDEEKKAAEEKAAADKKAADEKAAEDLAKENEKNTPKDVPYDRFKELVDKNKDLVDRLTKIETDKKEADEKQAKEDGKFEELFNSEKTRATNAESELLKFQVGTEKGLPATLIARLTGSTAEELGADADQLLELVSVDGKVITPSANPRRSQSKILDIDGMSPAEIRENKQKLLDAGAEAHEG